MAAPCQTAGSLELGGLPCAGTQRQQTQSRERVKRMQFQGPDRRTSRLVARPLVLSLPTSGIALTLGLLCKKMVLFALVDLTVNLNNCILFSVWEEYKLVGIEIFQF